MGRLVIRLSMLTLYAATIVLVPAVTPVAAKTGHSRHGHIKKHQRHWRYPHGAAWSAGPARPAAGFYAPSEPVCPGIGRSFDCKIWPPPYADDPDRKTSRY